MPISWLEAGPQQIYIYIYIHIYIYIYFAWLVENKFAKKQQIQRGTNYGEVLFCKAQGAAWMGGGAPNSPSRLQWPRHRPGGPLPPPWWECPCSRRSLAPRTNSLVPTWFCEVKVGWSMAPTKMATRSLRHCSFGAGAWGCGTWAAFCNAKVGRCHDYNTHFKKTSLKKEVLRRKHNSFT